MQSDPVSSLLQGCIAPSFSVFDDVGALELNGQCRLWDFMFERGGIHALFVRSGMGQMYTFGEQDAKSLVHLACRHAEGHVPVLAGCCGIWDRDYSARPNAGTYLKQSEELSRYAAAAGAAGVVHVIPEAIAPQGDESASDVVMRYFEAVCEAVPDTSVVIYQPPGTHPEYCLTPVLLRRLARIDNLAGAKVSDSDGAYTFDLIRAVAGLNFTYVTGAETIYYATLYAGSTACIGQGCCLNPQILNFLQTAHGERNYREVFRAQEVINELCAACPNPQDFFKRYATESGYPVNPAPRPSPVDPYGRAKVSLSDHEFVAYRELLERRIAEFI